MKYSYPHPRLWFLLTQKLQFKIFFAGYWRQDAPEHLPRLVKLLPVCFHLHFRAQIIWLASLFLLFLMTVSCSLSWHNTVILAVQGKHPSLPRSLAPLAVDEAFLYCAWVKGLRGISEELPSCETFNFSQLVSTVLWWWGVVLPTGPGRESDRVVTGWGTQASVSHWYGTVMTCRHFSIRSPGLLSSILETRDLIWKLAAIKKLNVRYTSGGGVVVGGHPSPSPSPLFFPSKQQASEIKMM